VVTVLAVLAFIAQLVIGHIPEGPQNRLAAADSKFLRQAGTQEIDWRPLSEETFAEARKRDLPIMLVLGSACSATGRGVDEFTFSAKEIEDFLDRSFISVRADTFDYPELVNAFIPISRALPKDGWRLGIPPDFQIWFLDPKGNMFAFAAETTYGRGLDVRAFRLILEDALRRFADVREGKGAAEQLQVADQAALRTPLELSAPDPNLYGAILSEAIDPATGGFPVNGFHRLWPCAWRFQLLSGRVDDYARSIDPCLKSPRVDLLDGGFFTGNTRPDWFGGGYDKLARVNADMLRTLTLGAVLTQRRDQRWLAEHTFDTLHEDFVQRGQIAGGRVGDSGRYGRSGRSSFSPRELREMFPDDDQREWLRDNLGLRVETNPEMTPLLGTLDLPFSQPERFQATLDKLRTKHDKPEFDGNGLLDVSGFTVARMIESARLLGDPKRLIEATDLFPQLENFRSLDDVLHSTAEGVAPHAYLGDYLGFADAALQHFLATGDPQSFDHGLAVLRRALFLYGGSAKGVYTLSQPTNAPLAPQNIASPEIVDNLGESCSAQIMRLCDDYGRLLGESGADLSRAADETRSRFSTLGPLLAQYAGGYYCAVLHMGVERHAIVVGPGAVATARRLTARNGLHLIAPAIGAVKAPGSKPGVYVVRGKVSEGPFTATRAAEILSGAAE
jgi:uncharacterized protein YyaL (SSP411 family)